MKKNLWIAGVTAIILSACASNKAVEKRSPLAGEWSIVTVDGKNVKAAEDGDAPFIGFDVKENRVYGNAGCNLLTGGLQADMKAGTIDFSALGSTRKMCQNMETERVVLNALGRTQKFEAKGKSLTFADAAGKTVMTLKRK